MAIDTIDHALCVGCGTCVETCPMDVFRMDPSIEKSTIAYQEDCQICHLCRIYCPEDAITVSPVKCARPMVGWG